MAVTPAKVSEWLNKLPGSWESPAATPVMMTLWCHSCISYRKRVLEAWPSPVPPGKDSSVGAVGGLCSDDKLGCQAVDLR